MAEDCNNPTRVSDHALEMVMRDVLDGMLELSLKAAYGDHCAEYKIIEITAGKLDNGDDRVASPDRADSAEILPFPVLRKAAC